jgi:tetratricopeptide (TPR) repeat protein
MNIGRKVQLGGLACGLFASAALAQPAPKNAPSQSKGSAQVVEDESTQKIWDSDVERVGGEIRKLQLKLKVKEVEKRAIEAYMKGDYDAVRALVPGILKMDPEAIEANEYLASADAQSGDDAKASKELDRAIDQRKEWLESHPSPEDQRDGMKHLSVLLGNRGAELLGKNPQRALEDFDAALKGGTPLKAMIMWEKSEALSELHRYEEAAKLYAEAVEKDPSLKAHGLEKFPDPTARNLCQVLAANGQNVQACN